MGSTSKILFQNLFMYARYCSARKIDVLDMEDTINKSLSPDQLPLNKRLRRGKHLSDA